MSKGITQGAAWALSIIFSILLFSGIVALILNVRPTGDSSYSSSTMDYGEISADDSDSGVDSNDSDQGEEIRSDDQASNTPDEPQLHSGMDEKKSLNGHIKA